MPDSPLTLIYTANLGGALDRLPPLFGLIQQARAAAPGPVCLVDLGGTCDPAVWECAETGGRAVLFILEAMGYDGACFSPEDSAALTPEVARRLSHKVLVALCSSRSDLGLPPYVRLSTGEWSVILAAQDVTQPASESALIVRTAADEADRLDAAARTLWLAPPAGTEIGVAQVTWNGPSAALTVQRHALRAGLRPDATVSAAVDFVRDEARYYQRSQQQGDAHAAG